MLYLFPRSNAPARLSRNSKMVVIPAKAAMTMESISSSATATGARVAELENGCYAVGVIIRRDDQVDSKRELALLSLLVFR